MMTKLPYYFHPTCVVAVDDDSHFLQALSQSLSMPASMMTFVSPFVALDTLNLLESHPLVDRCICRIENEFDEVRALHINLDKIVDEMENEKRFDEVSVLIVDYSMPGMDGLEFCRRLENPNIKKILLTGEADDSIAIHAFNEGLIDQYIVKSDPELSSVLHDAVIQMQKKYFEDQCTLIQDSIQQSEDRISPCLRDKAFFDEFFDYCQKNNIEEYYLAHLSGDFILIDQHGEKILFSVHTDYDVSELLGALDGDPDKTAKPEVMAQMQSKSSLPVFTGLNKHAIKPDHWEWLLRPVRRLVDGRYFCVCDTMTGEAQ